MEQTIEKVILDLNERLRKITITKQEDWLFIKNSIKSAIIDSKLENGSKTEIKFIPRSISDKLFDVAINGAAENILGYWRNQ